MTIINKLEKLATVNGSPCVSISFNTHRALPEIAQDDIVLKNLLKEAEQRVLAEFDKKDNAALLQKIASISSEIDKNNNLDSLHIYLSNDTSEIIKSALPVKDNKVHISDRFALRPIIKDYISSEEYLVLLLSQSGVKLYNAHNDRITTEVKNDDFPFPEMEHSLTDSEKLSDPKLLDNLVREYLNNVDKALVKIYNDLNLRCVVVCTEDNYSRLMQVADKPKMYYGHATVNYNNIATDHLAKQSFEVINTLQPKRNSEAINEMIEAIGKGNVYTDLQEIYSAAKDGRGDLLIIHEDFTQPVLMTGDKSFDLITDTSLPNAIDDITSNIAWEVLSKKGRVVFTDQNKTKEIGEIVLKTRY